MQVWDDEGEQNNSITNEEVVMRTAISAEDEDERGQQGTSYSDVQ